ncbi:hypothetical protein IQ06DRAFT_338947 [Phaeosphaeriaceae sp. SRC1lsM3a]|nr:hypothetical protein IQ06DRAFT_338947 [Stagonospora sp. SRC1lsM3a]
MADDDTAPPRPAEDAVSLHTIAEPDVYSTVEQEQADADYALALALEEEEEQRARDVTRSRAEAEARDALIARERSEQLGVEPYRDDVEAADVGGSDVEDGIVDDVPYRDDPDAEVEDADVEQHDPAPPKSAWGKIRHYIGISARWLRDSSRRATSWKSGIVKKALIAVLIALVGVAVLIGLVLLIGVIGASDEVEKPLTSKQRAFQESGSMNKYLILPKLYPDLEDSASYECRRVWEMHSPGLKCHEGILSTAWDKGDGDHIRAAKMDIYGYTKLVCDEPRTTCSRAIRALHDNMKEACDERTDRFDWDNYKKREFRYFDDKDGKDSGPMRLAQSLTARYDSLCDGPAAGFWGTPIEWDTYRAELWMRWGIADGKDAGRDLRYLDTFLRATSEKKTIAAHVEQGLVETETGPVEYKVDVPTRRVGPGDGDTDCGYSIRSWIERKWASFEYGAVTDLTTGDPMFLGKFNDLMEMAIKRCDKFEAGQMIRRRHEIWEQFGMWCDGAPCLEHAVPKVVLQLLRGLGRDDSPLPEIRAQINKTDAPVEALQALHEDLLELPCSIWMSEQWLKYHIMPFDFRVRTICSDECRNAIDRMQKRHGALFHEANRALGGVNIFANWDMMRRRADATCRGPQYNEMVTETTPLCAPGFAFLDRPEWIFEKAPNKKKILEAFKPAVEKLAKSLPDYIRKPSPDIWTQRRLARQLSESVCNRCSGKLLLGTTPDWTMSEISFGRGVDLAKQIEWYLRDDKDVDQDEYKRVAELYGATCNKIVMGSAWRKE